MTTRLQKQIEQLTVHRASEWLGILKDGEDAQHAQFLQWIAESPRHMEEFLSLVALDRELGRLDFGRRFDLDALRAEIHTSSVSELNAARPAARRTSTARAWKWAAGLAAATAIATLSVLLARGAFSPWQDFETAVGEQRSIELLDGSRVYINAGSAVRVRLDANAREVRLLRGEALFKVARDPVRPFRVRTPDAVVQVLGTEFNVYARPDGTTVAVLEGKVRVSSGRASAAPAALEAGQTAEVHAAGGIERLAHADVTHAVAWRQRQLVFDKTPLEEVVREFNRYNHSPQLRLEDIPAGSRHYSGNFDADDPDSLGAFLAREPDLSVNKENGQIVIRRR